MRKLNMDELNRKTAEECRTAERFEVVAVLENIRSAYNVGSVFRTADAFLIDSVILTGYTAVPPHKEIRKTALGAEESVLWRQYATAADAVEFLKASGYRVFAVEQVDNSISPETALATGDDKVAFVFGNEVSGVEQATIALCDGCVEIPQYGMKHSLNISVAAGIVLWEAVKAKRVG